MKRMLTVKNLNEGFVLNDGKEEEAYRVGHDYEAMQDAIGAVVLNFLNNCQGNTCTVTIEGPDKEKKF